MCSFLVPHERREVFLQSYLRADSSPWESQSVSITVSSATGRPKNGKDRPVLEYGRFELRTQDEGRGKREKAIKVALLFD